MILWGFEEGEGERFRAASGVFGLWGAVREGWWSRWGEHFYDQGIKKGFIRRVRGSRMNLCGVLRGGVVAYRLRSTSQGATPWCLSVRPSVDDFGRRWGLSFAEYEPWRDAVVLVGAPVSG